MDIGGDGELQNCDFEDELIEFVGSLQQKQDVELIINGDAFGLWEFTTLEGPEKLQALIEQQSGLFEQFRQTGAKIPITIMPGNQDYELDLVQQTSLVREVAGKKVWIEHGQQHDAANRMPQFGNPYAEPVGYFVTTGIVGTSGRYSDFGRDNWLKDLQAVMPHTDVPTWMISNYFYREMGPLLRLVILPFLLLFTLGVFVALGGLLQRLGILDFNPLLDNPLTNAFGITGDALRAILFVDGVITFFLLLAAIPGWFLLRDVRKTLKRYNVLRTEGPTKEADAPYVEAAKRVFEQNPDVEVFIYGHTHIASLKEVDGKAVINTGTWLKLPKKVPVLFGYLPPVYYPSFCLNYFRITDEAGRVAVHYERIEKEPSSELTWEQRLLTQTKRKTNEGVLIPSKTLLGTQGSDKGESLLGSSNK